MDRRRDSGPPVWCRGKELNILINMSQYLQLGTFENDSLQNIGWECLECIRLVRIGASDGLY
jgi:hypothetical protein